MQKQKVFIPTTDKEGFTHIILDSSKNEVCGAKERFLDIGKTIDEDELMEKFRYQIAGMCHNDLASDRASASCVLVAKEYSKNKLLELEKWIELNALNIEDQEGDNFLSVGYNEIVEKIKTLK